MRETIIFHHLKGLIAFQEEYQPKKSFVVSLDSKPRALNNEIAVLPWQEFLNKLWGGEIIS